MKKLNILLVSCFLVLISCTKKSDDSPTNPDGIIGDRAANLFATGDSANDILSNNKYTSLHLEIAYVSGFRPSSTAINSISDYIKLHTFKDDVTVSYQELESSGEEYLSLQEIADLERENRKIYNNGETLAIYIYFTDASSDEDEGEDNLVTLGAVYRNTSMVIHAATLDRLASSSTFISQSDIQIATVNHELGHLFGLVNLGSPPVNNHEDPSAENHCNVQGCLMQAELQFTSSNKSASVLTQKEGDLKSACSVKGATILSLLTNNAAKGLADVLGLNAQCILDLQANGGR